MKLNQSRLMIVSVIAVASCCAPALQMSAQQGAAAPDAASPSKSITQAVTRFENNLMAMAEAMPADKYNFAPSKDLFKTGSPADFATVRTFAQQLTHIAGEPFRFFPPFGVAPDPSVDPKSFDSLTSKDDIIKALKASFDYQNKVIATMTPLNALTPTGQRGATLVSTLIAMLNDDGDHYGQMVEYMRMNGLIPPATVNQQANRPRPATQK
jgi:hypothetical protein